MFIFPKHFIGEEISQKLKLFSKDAHTLHESYKIIHESIERIHKLFTYIYNPKDILSPF